MKFSKDLLVEVLDLPYEAIEDDIIDTSRWSEHHEIIFKYKDKYYRTEYSCGSTEIQDESPWEYEEEIECQEVEQRKVEETRWVAVAN